MFTKTIGNAVVEGQGTSTSEPTFLGIAGLMVDVEEIARRILPIGSIIMFSGSSIPDGWLPCDGKNDTPNFRFSLLMGAINPEQTGNPTMIPTGEIEAGLQAVFVCLIIKVR
ncbi:tail fiber protein [Collimonas humicola]|uniref:tail fiber protein n=1 Tax=Collimonas humicola TaxID=2825886 RepID=UPI001B8B7D53|nr:tail fiber protein [Collimonas humicola]